MKATDRPAQKIDIPWGQNAGAQYIRQVPDASQIAVSPGAASFTDGYPPLNFTPVSGGGIPPHGADMNGVTNIITAWIRWQIAGGQMVFDSTFATSIGGYPNGAVLRSADFQNSWTSLVDNNLVNPDISGAGANWRMTTPGYTPVQQGTGPGQDVSHPVKIGWSPSASKTKIAVDQVDFGNLALETWVTQTFAPQSAFTNDLTNATTLQSTHVWASIFGGLIIQIVSGVTTTGVADLVTFPIAFPNKVIGMSVSDTNASGIQTTNPPTPTYLGISNATATNFLVYAVRLNITGGVYIGGAGYQCIALGI